MASTVAIFMPIALLWRWAGIAAGFLVVFFITLPPIGLDDRGFGYTVGVVVLTGIVLTLAAILGIRLAVGVAQGRPLNREGHGTVRLTQIMFGIIGAAGGLTGAVGLSYGLAGIPGKLFLDVSVILLALAVGVWAALRRWIWLMTGAGTTILVAAFGASQSQRILTQAETLANGRPWCLVSGPEARPITSPSELGFFTLPKGGSVPHLALLWPDEAGLNIRFHWSIRSQEWRPSQVQATGTCFPQTDYATELRAGRVRVDTFVVGSDIYRVPADMLVRARPDQITIASDVIVGPEAVTSFRFAGWIDMDLGQGPINLQNDHLPLSALNTATGPDRVQAQGKDANGWHTSVDCFQGIGPDLLCNVVTSNAHRRYRFEMPSVELAQRQAITARVLAIFDGFKLAN